MILAWAMAGEDPGVVRAAIDAARLLGATRKSVHGGSVELSCPSCHASSVVEELAPARVPHAREGCDGTPFVRFVFPRKKT